MRETLMDWMLGFAVGGTLALAAFMPGCQPAKDAGDARCSDAAFRSLGNACKRAIDQAQSPEEVDAITDACKLLIDEQTKECGG